MIMLTSCTLCIVF